MPILQFLKVSKNEDFTKIQQEIQKKNMALFDLFTLLFYYLFYLYLQKVYYYSIIVYYYCI